MKKNYITEISRRNQMTDYEKILDIIFGRWRSQILYAGVKIGVFDCVKSLPKGHKTFGEGVLR